MNIINKVTIRHLKENKRRSLVTIIGVIISVAMITAVATLGVSFLDLMIRHEIADNGEWHVQYKNVTPDQIEAISKDSETKSVVLSSDGFAALEESKNENKPYLYFKNYNKSGLEHFPIKVMEGRLPHNENEIAISEAIKTNAKVKYKIGDELTVDIGDRWDKENETTLTQTDFLKWKDENLDEELKINETKTVKIVGTIERPAWEPSWSPGYTVIGYVDEQSLSEKDTVDALVVLKKLNGSLYDHVEALAKSEKIEKFHYNTELLRYYGVTKNDNLRMTLFSLAGIIMGIIIIGSVALIYNAFAISVSERARHLGMLSSVGATKKQKRNSVFFEGTVIGLISIPIGILAGLAGIGITFVLVNKYLQAALGVSEKLELVVTPASLFIACGVSIVTIFISTYIPAQKASKISAIDAIRQTHDIKLSGKTVKTSKLVRKVFGLEAEIGLKNVKRNKKRYLATVFSLVISIVLFLSVSYFTDNLKKSLAMSQNDIQFDIQIFGSKVERDELTELTKVEHVTKATIMKEVQLDALIEMDHVPEQLKTNIKEQNLTLEDGKFLYFVMLTGMDQKSFNAFAKQIGVDAHAFSLSQQDTPKAIVVEKTSYEDYVSGKFVESKTIEAKVGDKIDLLKLAEPYSENEQPKRDFVSTIEIGALTDQIPIGIYPPSLGGVIIIVPEATIDQLAIDTNDVSTFVYLSSKDPMATQTAIEDRTESGVEIYNVYQQRKDQEQTILLLSVFTYGFITLISLISVANIFNTISTSISLRKREFAMLRSVGMTPKGFNKMIQYESIFYGVKALLYGLPISVLVMFLIHRSTGYTFEYEFSLPWMSILFVMIMIFLIVGSAMLYSISKIKNENIIDSLKQENI